MYWIQVWICGRFWYLMLMYAIHPIWLILRHLKKKNGKNALFYKWLEVAGEAKCISIEYTQTSVVHCFKKFWKTCITFLPVYNDALYRAGQQNELILSARYCKLNDYLHLSHTPTNNVSSSRQNNIKTLCLQSSHCMHYPTVMIHVKLNVYHKTIYSTSAQYFTNTPNISFHLLGFCLRQPENNVLVCWPVLSNCYSKRQIICCMLRANGRNYPM